MTNGPLSTRSLADDASALRLAPVTPEDAAPLPQGPCRGLFVGEAGELAVEDLGGRVTTLLSGASQYHPIRVRRVLATGTTAARIVALY